MGVNAKAEADVDDDHVFGWDEMDIAVDGDAPIAPMDGVIGLLFELRREAMDGFESSESTSMRTRILRGGFSALPRRRREAIRDAVDGFAGIVDDSDRDWLGRRGAYMCMTYPDSMRALLDMISAVAHDVDGLRTAADRVCGPRGDPVIRADVPGWMKADGAPRNRMGPCVDRDIFLRAYWDRLCVMTTTVIHQMPPTAPCSESELAYAFMAGGSICCVPSSHYSEDATMSMAADMASADTFADLTLMRIGAVDDALGPAARRVASAVAEDDIRTLGEYVAEGMIRVNVRTEDRHPAFAGQLISWMEGPDDGGVVEAVASMILATVSVVGVIDADVLDSTWGNRLQRLLSRPEAEALGDGSRTWPRFVVDDTVPQVDGLWAFGSEKEKVPLRRVVMPTITDLMPNLPLDESEWVLSLDLSRENATELKAAFRRIVSMTAGSSATMPDTSRMDVDVDATGIVEYEPARPDGLDALGEPARAALYLHDGGLMRDVVSVSWFVSALGEQLRRDRNRTKSRGLVRVPMSTVDDAIGYMCDGCPVDFVIEVIRTAALPVEPLDMDRGFHPLGPTEGAAMTPMTGSARHVCAIGMLVVDARECAMT